MDYMHLLILRPRDQAILATNDYFLAYYDCPNSFATESSEACQFVQKKLHAKFHLNYLHQHAEYNNDPNYPRYFTHGICVLEALLLQDVNNSPEAPDGYKWIPFLEATKIKPEADDEKEIGRASAITAFLSKFSASGLNSYIDRLRPYSCPEWYTTACAWVKEKVLEVTGQNVNRIVKLRSASSGCTLQAETADGTRFFMKAVGRGNNNERVIANSLHKHLPKHFPKLLYQNEKEGWMLMNDYGTPLTTEQCSLKRNHEFGRKILLKWADIQMQSTELAHELLKDGIPKVDGYEVLRQVKSMVWDDEWMEAQRNGLRHESIPLLSNEKYRKEVIEHAECVIGDIEKLDLPLCLVHGDLNPVNICSKDGTLTFFDYEATMISYSFVDALTFGFVCNDYGNVQQDTINFYMEELKLGKLSKKEFEAMRKFKRLLNELYAFNRWKYAEDGEKLLAQGEMGSPFAF